MSPFGTKLPIRNVRSPVANGAKRTTFACSEHYPFDRCCRKRDFADVGMVIRQRMHADAARALREFAAQVIEH
jgi:hypothetical protein